MHTKALKNPTNNRKRLSFTAILLLLAALMAVFTAAKPAAAAVMGNGYTQPIDGSLGVESRFLANSCTNPSHPGYGGYGGGLYHIGTDYTGTSGQAVYALAAGTVTKSQYFESTDHNMGFVVMVEHVAADGSHFVAVYGHLNDAGRPAVNATVTAGQQIGTLYNLDADTYGGPHLHLGIHPGTASGFPSNHWGTMPCGSWPANGSPDTNGFMEAMPYLNAHGLGSGGGGTTGTHNPTLIGAYYPTPAVFDLRKANTGGEVVKSIQYGNSNMIPLAGDWDGNGTVTIGDYDPSTATFYLRNSNDSGNANITLQFGNIGATPIVGNWDGGPVTSVGVYYPSTAVFDLRSNNTVGDEHVKSVQFGNIGAIPIVGNWDGTTPTSIGVYYPNMAVFDLRSNTTVGDEHVTSVQYGNSNMIPLAGDWDGDGVSTIGIYNPNTAVFDLRNENSPGNADWSIQYGNIGAKPFVGAWTW